MGDGAYYQRNREAVLSRNRKWRQDNLVQDKNRKKAYYQENREQILDKTLQKTYGITSSQFEEMNTAQNGLCAICGERQTKRPFKLCVDHCHGTGTIRGLLCSLCNRALGLMRDRPELLRKAAEYLEKDRRVVPPEDSGGAS